MKNQVLAVYKSLLKAQRSAFNGDIKGLIAAKHYTRQKFMEHKHEANTTTLESLINTARQAELIVRQNVVQGVKKDKEDVFGKCWLVAVLLEWIRVYVVWEEDAAPLC
ncbi:hypothetical protein SmJEL517_g05744 [Synchytrium microbalum]|uniref:Mitochondrial zinc maintenance protein 1, mitochondrial n=1 Tax=Synchytrium microbalum TaxID=1806994 RepID=A0A507BUX8_9FUNG|nr:uncharacterized protein SmJEL517_g05744 [Synchytrium microbalum]TPX30779.1 hypothetical protein SmJEL517_g05744 [Synchytrium microbalum]